MPFSQDVQEDLLVKSGRCCCLCHKYKGNKMNVHHIIQEADGGSNEANNGIPLCLDCHAEVMAYNPRHPVGKKITPSELRKHRDQWFALVAGGQPAGLRGEPWRMNLHCLYYINVPRMSMLAAQCGIGMQLDGLEGHPSLHSIGFGLCSVLLAFEKVVGMIQPTVVPLSSISAFSNECVGARVEFDGNFRSRNVPGPSDHENGTYRMTGTLAADPHLYTKVAGFKLILTLDPRWITTTDPPPILWTPNSCGLMPQ